MRSGKKLALAGLACGLALVLLAAGAWAGCRYALAGAHVDARGAELVDHSEHLALLIGRATVEARNAKESSRRALDEWGEYRLAVERRDIERRNQLDRIVATVDGHLSGINAISDGIDGDLELARRSLALVDVIIAGLDELHRGDGRPP